MKTTVKVIFNQFKRHPCYPRFCPANLQDPQKFLKGAQYYSKEAPMHQVAFLEPPLCLYQLTFTFMQLVQPLRRWGPKQAFEYDKKSWKGSRRGTPQNDKTITAVLVRAQSPVYPAAFLTKCQKRNSLRRIQKAEQGRGLWTWTRHQRVLQLQSFFCR